MWQRSVHWGLWHQVCLEFCKINFQGLIKLKGTYDGRHNPANEVGKVSVSWELNIEVSPTDIIDGLAVNQEGTIRVLQSGVGAEMEL